MRTRRLWAFILVCLLLVPCIGLCQKREAQERDIDRFTFTLGLKTLFLADTEISYPDVGKVPNPFKVHYEGNLFGPVLSVQIANTDMFWDNFEFVVSSYFGDLDAYDSVGDVNAVDNQFSLDLTYVRVDACYRIIPHFSLFIDYHYKKFEFGRRKGDWPSDFADDEEMFGGGFGMKAGIPLGQSGVFVYGSGEFMPYAEFLINDSDAWGLMLKGGLGYTIEGGEWLPVALTTTVGYYYQKLDSDGYFDEQTDAASADIVVSW